MTRTAITDRPSRLTLDQQLDEPVIPATQDMPPELLQTMNLQSGIFVLSESKPKMDFATTEVSGVPGTWRVLESPRGEKFSTVIPGGKKTRLRKPKGATVAKDDSSEGYRPEWIAFEYVPPLRPFRVGNDLFLEPRAHEDTNRLSYPNCCVGFVTGSHFQGSGVLVGPNLMLTAGHNIPWDATDWFMEFRPAFRRGETPPFGISFVREVIGYDTFPDVTGYDWAICQLFNPLGRVAGWMGSRSFGNQDTYFQRSYNSSGYPGHFQERMAIELDMGLRDIDNDAPGLELEFVLRADFTEGWSGGPLWLPNEGPGPRVMGIMSGHETDELDPRRVVFAGGSGMVDLVREGAATWPA